MEAARQAILTAPKKKRGRKKGSTNGEPKTQLEKPQWIDDLWGNQGCVYFNEGKYWGVDITEAGQVKSITWNEEEWTKRKGEKYDELGRGSLVRGTNERIVGNKRQPTRPSRKRRRNASSKTRSKENILVGESSSLAQKQGKYGKVGKQGKKARK